MKYGSQLYYASSHWQNLRLKVIQRDGWKCTKCGAGLYGKKRGSSSPFVDHIKPRDKASGYPTDLDVADNLASMCGQCHTRKTFWEDTNREEKKTTGEDGYPVESSDWCTEKP